jgi:uncharacterized protein YqhQ
MNGTSNRLFFYSKIKFQNKKMVKNKIGGMTNMSSIMFVGLKYKVTIKDDGCIVNPYNNPSDNKFEKIPFIRGFLKFINMFKMALSTWIGKISIFFFAVAFIFFIIGLFYHEPINIDDTFIDYFINGIYILSLGFLLIYTFKIRNLHGLEHKIIGCYNKNLPFTINNIKKQNKETPQCGGTMLGIIIFLFFLISYILNWPGWTLYLIIPSIGFEIFLNAKGQKWYNKMLYLPGYLFQLLTTGHNVSDTIILKYMHGFSFFISKEDPDYFNNMVRPHR